MPLIALLIFFVAPLTYVLWSCAALIRNVALAKESGIPYVVTPWYPLNPVWLIIRPFFLHLLQRPPFRGSLWVGLLSPDWSWTYQYTFFRELGCDTFIHVTPAVNTLCTAEASAISEIVNRKMDFPKTTQLYGSLNIYGKNIVSSEGQTWRHHRKIVSPSFNEKTHRMVWFESLRLGQDMVKSWMDGRTVSSSTVTSVSGDAMRLTLYVISYAGFGVTLLWPNVDKEKQSKTGENLEAAFNAEKATETQFHEEHEMSYFQALNSLLKNLVPILLLPKFALDHLPIEKVKLSKKSYIEWGKYLQELLRDKKANIGAKKEKDGMDLMGALVKGAGIADGSTRVPSYMEKGRTTTPKQLLTDDEIIGNAFVILLAGHETTANSIHFAIDYLAMHPSSQRRLQVDLDRIFAGRPINEWDYERDFSPLFSGMAGAVLAEELRHIPPVPNIPKWVPATSAPQALIVNGQKRFVPSGTYINLVTLAAHRNPNQWPHGPPSDPANPAHPTSNQDNDLEEFKPERWFRGASIPGPEPDEEGTAPISDGAGTFTGTNMSSAFIRPPRGAYVPFSEGPRACLGRRFAQVEVLAVLAVIFSQYSVELAVDDWATDAEVEKMSIEERRAIWEKAKTQVKDLMHSHISMILSMQLRKGVVP
ncbi:MAG: hypothetical protein Q9214_005676, partial [Letrouitia sp. 1 TL-2023]